MWILKPLEKKSCDLKKQGKKIKKTPFTFFLPFPPQPGFSCWRSACACKPLITLAHANFYRKDISSWYVLFLVQTRRYLLLAEHSLLLQVTRLLITWWDDQDCAGSTRFSLAKFLTRKCQRHCDVALKAKVSMATKRGRYGHLWVFHCSWVFCSGAFSLSFCADHAGSFESSTRGSAEYRESSDPEFRLPPSVFDVTLALLQAR